MNNKNFSIQTIGHGCYGPLYLRKLLGYTTYSSPFSWNTIPNIKCVIDIIKNDFKDYVSPIIFNDKTRKGDCNKYGVNFQHDYTKLEHKSSNIIEKYNRRINRFNNILKYIDYVILLWSKEWATNNSNKWGIDRTEKCKYENLSEKENLENLCRQKYNNPNIYLFFLDDEDSHIKIQELIEELRKKNYKSIEENENFVDHIG
tara:strand:+ start:486 stop:1091 length:606 start_codon:yes stop_codon:yes gene_type:complete